MTDILTPQQKLWNIAEELWPRLIDRRPMHVQAIAPSVDEALAIELSDEMVGGKTWRRPELKIARFIVDAETDGEVVFVVKAEDARRTHIVEDPFLAYYADIFSRIDIERSIA